MHVSILRHVYVIYPGKTAFLDLFEPIQDPGLVRTNPGNSLGIVFYLCSSVEASLQFRICWAGVRHDGRAFDSNGILA